MKFETTLLFKHGVSGLHNSLEFRLYTKPGYKHLKIINLIELGPNGYFVVTKWTSQVQTLIYI